MSKLEPNTLSFRSIINDIDEGSIKIPTFQRDFVWGKTQVAELLNSIYEGYPIGSFIFWQTDQRLDSHRTVGNIQIPARKRRILTNYVLDGQQRITSLYAAVKEITIDNKNYLFYFDLKNRKYVFSNKKGEYLGNKQYIPLKKIFNSKRSEYYLFLDAYSKTERAILHEVYDRFHDYKFSAIYITKEDNLSKICKAFEMINTTGKKLTPVAIMISRAWSEKFPLREKLNKLQSELKNEWNIPEIRVLQLISMILHEDGRNKTKDIYNLKIRDIEKIFDKASESLKLSIDFFKRKLNIHQKKFLSYDFTLLPVAYLYYHKRTPTEFQISELKKWYFKASIAGRYSGNQEAKGAEDIEQIKNLIKNQKPHFNYAIDWKNIQENLIRQEFSFGNALSKTILNVYALSRPRTFDDGQFVDLDKPASKYNKKNLHHLFPKDYLSKTKHNSRKNSIVNICFTPALQNIQYSNRAPKDYFSELAQKNKKLTQTLKSHLITNANKFGITTNNYSLFLEQRSKEIIRHLKILIK